MNSEKIKKNITKTIKLNIIKNANRNGWNAEVKDRDTIILRKKINVLRSDEKNTDMLIDSLLNIKHFGNSK